MRTLSSATRLGPTLAMGALALACSSTSHDGGPTGPDVGAKGPCDLSTGYDGDDRCIAPPTAAGFQLHVGPTDYSDPTDVARFLMQPDDESVECYYVKTGNTEDVYNQRKSYRMRPGSHHLILKTSDTPREDGWGPCPAGLGSGIGGTQRAIFDTPGDPIAPEDKGLASVVKANTQVAAELHFFNTTGKPILRETWVNFYYMDASEVTELIHGVALIGGLSMAVQPGATENIQGACVNTLASRRIVSFQGHAHAHTARVSAWKHHGSDPRELVYEMYNWEEPFNVAYNTVVQNTLPDPTKRIDGGSTGTLTLGAGNTLEWECEVQNTSNLVLKFANEVHTAEMCNLFGGTLGDTFSCLQ